jgi:uncharacterized integral membrane protein (TIGR00698 family)
MKTGNTIVFLWLIAAIMLPAFVHSPAQSLLIGALISLIWGNPVQVLTGKIAKYMLQSAVILLGFGLQFNVVLRVGFSSIGITFVSITLTLLMGWWLGRLFLVERDLTVLLSSGTAICGGSAIAAIAPAIGASQTHTAVALAVVFLLNALALLIFPFIGHLFNLSQPAFGLWSALAIHDTSSVVGAAAIYGTQALAIGTTVKLTRALWILPLSFAASRLRHSKSTASVPWFLAGFLLAAISRSYLPNFVTGWNMLASGGKYLMVATLFLIGSGLSPEKLRSVGTRPLAKAVILWVLVSVISLIAVLTGWINIDTSVLKP